MDLAKGGGSPLLQSSGPYIGPGHAGIFVEGDATWISYHYYSAEHNGRSRLDLLPVQWTGDDWPRVTPRPIPFTPKKSP
jgi:arabinan endo-1,5-alpha-L-arabinosidase